MITSYIRSSSYGNWDVCPQQYYINYILGQPRAPNFKAEKGTIAHKILEILAIAKQHYDTGSQYISFVDDCVGEVSFHRDEFLTPYMLHSTEVDKINASRADKKVYISPCKLEYGHTRYGYDIVEHLCQRVFNFYITKNGWNNWTSQDYKDCENWVWMALDYENGMFDPRKRKIVSPENAFDFAIEADWAKFKDPNGQEQYLRIKGTIDLITEIDSNTYQIIDWKGLPVETLLPTPNGWVTIGDSQVGDIVFDKDGKQTKILAKSKKSYKQCYKIYFDDTTDVTCDNEHLWLINNKDVVPTPKLEIGQKIKLTESIDIDDINLPIDPYVLGVWLGDGRNRSGEISGADRFIFEEIERRGYKVGKNINKRDEECQYRTIFGLTKILKTLNLINNKHIPNIYLRASINQRMDLLRGLMDTDGNVNLIRKQTVFTNCNKQLSDNVKELLWSLGQRPNQGHIVKNYKYKNNPDKICNVYPIHFRPIGINPFLLPRKLILVDENWGTGQSSYKTITKIELLDIHRETQCIMVDSPSSTYLCTENMLPTHNTGRRTNFATGEEKTYGKLCKDPQLMLYYYAARQLFPLVDNILLTIFFVRDGGPFTVYFDDKSMQEMETLLKERIHEIWNCTTPKLVSETQTSFKCTYLCDYYKNKWPGTDTNICKHIQKKIQEEGIDHVTKTCTYDGHSHDKYNAPGGV